MKAVSGKTEIKIIREDITEIKVDAIVNAANSHLAHGGGVAGAIVRKGGSIIQEESNLWIKSRGIVPAGSCAITSAGILPAKYVIHAVGPRMGEGDEDKKLKQATENALQTADKHCLKSIAFPAVSTGIFGYPVKKCAKIMLKCTAEYAKGQTGLEKVVFCLFDEDALHIFGQALQKIL